MQTRFFRSFASLGFISALLMVLVSECIPGESCGECYDRCHGDDCDATCGGACGN